MVGLKMPQEVYLTTRTSTERREPSGLAVLILSRVFGDVRRYPA